MPRFLHLCERIAEVDRSLRFYKALELPGEIDSRLILEHEEDADQPVPSGYSHLMIWVEDMAGSPIPTSTGSA
jgi:hypothetical protein